MRFSAWLSIAVVSCVGYGFGANAQQYWMGQIQRRGKVAFRADPNDGYPVFRNVKDFGAVGDGVTDDTNAINNAVAFPGTVGILPAGNSTRCGGGTPKTSTNSGGQNCGSSTIQPAIVYFPSGTYKVSRPIVLWYMTQMIGDAINPPKILVLADYKKGGGSDNTTIGSSVFDANIYIAGFFDPAKTWWDNQNNFYRQIRNFEFDLTQAPVDVSAIHWQVAQATSMQNIKITMRPKSETNNGQVGINMENGSGGLFSDIKIYGGAVGMTLGSQQFTTRSIYIEGSKTAVKIIFDWTWLFAQHTIVDCDVGFDLTTGGTTRGTTHTQMIVDSKISATVGILSLYKPGRSAPQIAGSLMLERVDMTGSAIGIADGVSDTANIILPGGQFIPLFVQGHVWTTAGQEQIGQVFNDTTCTFQNTSQQVRTAQEITVQKQLTPIPRPAVLVDQDGSWVGRARPQYEDRTFDQFLSAKAEGLVGDGVTDDTAKMQAFFTKAAALGSIAYFDKGAYIVRQTVQVPKDLKIVGELWAIIMSQGSYFQDPANPKVMWRVGNPGELGTVEISDIVFETQGPCPGAILVEWNIKQATPGHAGMWDAHYRIGGTYGTDILVDKCRKSPGTTITQNSQKVQDCMGAFLLLHVTPQANIYMENVWGWVADHQLDEKPDRDQLYVFNGRGFLIEGDGPNWLWGTASEHSVMYSYQMVNNRNTWMGIIQHETAYYQGNPPAPVPFAVDPRYHDPDFSNCLGPNAKFNCPRTWGMRFINSAQNYIYGSGSYMFFNNWDAAGCLGTETCQESMHDFRNSTDIWLWGLVTKGSEFMVSWDGTPLIPQSVNKGPYAEGAILFEMTANQ